MGVAEPADVYFYLMPKFSIFNKLTMGASMDKIKKGTDKGFYDNLMFYTDGLKEYKKDLEVEKTDQPFIYVLDKTGKIVHVEKGVCNENLSLVAKAAPGFRTVTWAKGADKAESLGRFKIEEHLDLRCLLDRKVCRLFTLKHPARVDTG